MLPVLSCAIAVRTAQPEVAGAEALGRQEAAARQAEQEMAQVHLAQLRGAPGQDTARAAEVASLSMELQQARDSLAEALASRDHVSRERDQLAEQYRSYSRDLAGQAERLSKQLRRYQEENAKMVHREAGLVQHVAELKSKLQTIIRGGRSVTEEEVCRLED